MFSDKCLLCGYKLEGYGRPYDSDTAFLVKCPNCGEYKLPFSLHELLENHYYSEQGCIMASGKVFEASYYKQIPKLLSENDFDASPKILMSEKLCLLAKYIYTATDRGATEIDHRPACCYQKNDQKYAALLKELKTRDIIDYTPAEDDSEDYAGQFLEVKMTVKGNEMFEKGINLPTEVEKDFVEIEKSIHKLNSKSVFVAMSFNKSMESVRMCIKKAIEEAGLEPVLIDEVEHINYIPLEIQNKIKNSGLLVVELTTQNNGAYFEAGYAMGLNIPVVWCCKDDDKANLHFDIRQYNTILWKDENELSERLKKRLVAIM